MDRRSLLGALVTAPLVAACRSEAAPPSSRPREPEAPVILGVEALGAQWRTPDPFLFCVHHDDGYPAGNAELGPATPLDGRATDKWCRASRRTRTAASRR